MERNNNHQSAEPPKQATTKGVAVELNEEAIANLTGFFDVLIQMDLEQQSNERDSHERRDDVRDASDTGKTLPEVAISSRKARHGKSKG